MAVTFILGRAGTGKTRYCVESLLAALRGADDSDGSGGARGGDGGRLVLLVPEQASFQMERAVALGAPRGAYTRAEVLSFSRLARRVFGASGVEPVLLDPRARAMALRAVAAGLGDALRVYRAAARTGGFFEQLARLIEELLAEAVTPAELEAAATKLPDAAAQRKARELARLYAEYTGWLRGRGVEPALRLAELRGRLARAAWLHGASIWVDGFAGFTGQEVATLVALARLSREMHITLLLDPDSPRVAALHAGPPAGSASFSGGALFERTETTYRRLIARFDAAGVTRTAPLILRPASPPRFAASPVLGRLESGLARGGDPPTGAPAGAARSVARPDESAERTRPTVRLLECGSHRQELEQAARFIRRRVAEAGGRLRFRDFAVIARDLEPFARLVAEVFEDFEIPYFLDRRRPMRSHPLSRLIEALFQTATGDFRVVDTTRLLRTGLLPLTREQAEELENLVAAYEVCGGDLWQAGEWRFDDERPISGIAAPAAAGAALDAARLRIVAALEPLRRCVASASSPNGRAWAEAIYSTLDALGVRRRIEGWIAEAQRERAWERAETHRLAWESLCDVLDDLHAVLGDTPLPASDAASVVASAVGELTLGLAPPTLDQVLVSSIERSRHPDIRYAWVFAFNEGVFPAPPPEDALLSSEEREALVAAGLPAPTPQRDEAFGERLLAYIALTRASHGLTISFARTDEDGQPRLPSPLLDDVLRVLPELRIERPAADEPPVCLTELAAGALRRRRYARLCDELRRTGEHAARLDWLLRGQRYRNEPAPIGNYRQREGSPYAWVASPSEIETYVQCPFKHYALYGLRLDAQRGPTPLRWDFGRLAHRLLADLTRRAMAEPGGVRAVPDARWLELLAAALNEHRAALPADFAARRPQAAFLFDVLARLLPELVLAHAARWRRGAFEPVACEAEFGRAHVSPARSGPACPPGGPDRAGDSPARMGPWQEPDAARAGRLRASLLAPDDAGILPALELHTASGERIAVRGVIDRIDRCDDRGRTLLLVYDYKSSAHPIRATFLTQDRLQLFTYLLALKSAAGEPSRARGPSPALELSRAPEPSRAADASMYEPEAAGVFLAPLYPWPGALDTQTAAAATPEEQRMLLFRPRGLFDEEAAERLDAGRPASSPVASMRRKKDGGFWSKCDVVSGELIAAMADLARQTILQAAEGVRAGAIDVAPLLESNTLACGCCDFADVCRYDPALSRAEAPRGTAGGRSNRPRIAERCLPVLAAPAANDAEAAE